MRTIDLNGDLGESFGRWSVADDRDMLPWVSSVNLACGFHAGEPSSMREAVRAANDHRVAIGAHPSFPDLRGFGRTPMALPPKVIRDDLLYQLGALAAICRAEGATLRHVKPHGALYHAIAGDPDVALAATEAIASFDPGLPLVIPARAATLGVLQESGLPLIFEAFLDRGYAPDGRLLPRGRPGAVLEDRQEIVDRALALALEGRVRASDGSTLLLDAHTLCLHGDGAHAGRVARTVRDALERAGVRVAPHAP
jgi:UPF0271 protein